MNLPSIRHLVLPPLTLCVIALTAFFIPRLHSPTSESGLYDTCGQLVIHQPAAATELAARWLQARPESFSARHCEALATYAIGNYPVAAKKLSALADDAHALNPSLAVHLYLQSAKAFHLGADGHAAASSVSKALAIDPSNAEGLSLSTVISTENTPGGLAPAAGEHVK